MTRCYKSRVEEAGILREITGQARNRICRAGEVLAAMLLLAALPSCPNRIQHPARTL